MEYDFNQNYDFNDNVQESEGDSITIDNNTYEDYSEEFQIEENQNENKQEGNGKENDKVKNAKSQKNKSEQQTHKNKKSHDIQTENNINDSQEEDEPLKVVSNHLIKSLSFFFNNSLYLISSLERYSFLYFLVGEILCSFCFKK